jgi:hypothetical protein
MEALIIIGAILVVLGVIGSVIPAMPGPLLSFSGIVLLFFAKGGETVSLFSLIIFAVAMAILTIIDYAAPILGAKFFGASKKGMVGAIIGALAGIIFFPPLGIFLGAFIGAIIGELYQGKTFEKAARAGAGVMLGSVSVIILQTVFSLWAAIYFFVKVF